MSIVLKTPSNGSVTLAEQDTASNVTVTIPATTGNAVISTPDLAYSPYVGFRNRIINGGMTIDQRNAGASVTPTATAFTIDRWIAGVSQSSKFSVQQNAGAVTPPVGFVNYLGVTSLSAYAVLSSDTFSILQRVEGFNLADLAWGTASAATVTLSFWVRSSLTGTFGGALRNGNANRSYPFTYTISAANTFEYKTITIAGDTSGTWLTTNGTGATLYFGLGVGATFSGTAGAWAGANYLSATGAVSVVGTSGATFYITGVQLEKGSTATPFEFRSIGDELALCQRYYFRIFPGTTNALLAMGNFYTGTTASLRGSFPVEMRIAPTSLEQTGTANQYSLTQDGFGGATCTSVPTFSSASKNYFRVTGVSTGAAFTAPYPSSIRTDTTNGAGAYLGFSAEL